MKLKTLQKFLWGLAGIALIAFAGVHVFKDRLTDPSGVDGAAFSAAFKLTDHRGMVQTQDDFSGRWMLIFFGFTNCPDVCPTTLSEVAAVMESLGSDADKVQPIFITIDPERDTPTVLAEYVPLFDAGILGLTGTPTQIEKTKSAFPIFFERIEEASAIGRYTMAHTSHLFLFDPEAGFSASWPYGTAAEKILADIKDRI